MENKAQKKLIVNADDYGLDQAACYAIIELSKSSLISSTSIMANLATDEQLEKIALQKNISTGWHINIVEGKPLSHPEEIPSLLDEKEEFLSSKRLLMRSLSGRIKKDHIRIEMRAQYDRLIDAGINISHADAHQHTHQLPFAGPLILGFVQELGITKVRFGKISDNDSSRMKLLRFFHKMNKKNAEEFISPDILITTLSAGEVDFHKLSNSIQNAFLEADSIEIMTHPATNNSKTYLDRVGEYELWKSKEWEEFLSNTDIELIPYNKL